ncbi:MAG: hypothetical protein PHC34_00690 [Candidatus Gastranaerophilales bacterium]|nr:hypothetical protein [Candidatus Gastranaerophilales bacterium]
MDLNVNKLVNDATLEILVNKNPKKVIRDLYELINTSKVENEVIKSVLAFAFFENKNYFEAAIIYHKLNKYYQAGFCELLLGNKAKARELWFNAQDSGAVCWARCLIDLIEVKVDLIPTFLQIRNHLESDLGYFIQAGKLDYAENVIQCSDFLADINPETNKFIGKALMNNGFSNLSVNFFLKSQELIPNDPEVYFYIARYSFETGALNEARHFLKQCIDLNASYTPAKKLLDEIGEVLLSNVNKD